MAPSDGLSDRKKLNNKGVERSFMVDSIKKVVNRRQSSTQLYPPCTRRGEHRRVFGFTRGLSFNKYVDCV